MSKYSFLVNISLNYTHAQITNIPLITLYILYIVQRTIIITLLLH